MYVVGSNVVICCIEIIFEFDKLKLDLWKIWNWVKIFGVKFKNYEFLI